MAHVTERGDLCFGRAVCGRVLVEPLPIAVADDEHDAEDLIVVGRHG